MAHIYVFSHPIPSDSGLSARFSRWPIVRPLNASKCSFPALFYCPGLFCSQRLASFTGLRGEWKLDRYDEIIPLGNLTVLAIAVLGAALLALAPSDRDDYGLLRNIALGQMLVVLSAGLLQALATRGADITYFSYGSFFSFFAVVAAMLAIARDRYSAGIGPAPRETGKVLG